MSFKREGNDGSLLGILKKRRIKDLLSDDVPENEAKLLCNGRFTCTVCSNNPIFDTVNMLAVHRKGKKHQYYQQIHETKKKELSELVRQRQQQDMLKYGQTSIKGDTSGKFSLLSTPYNPCAKKGKLKAGARKPRLDLSNDQSTRSDSTTTSTTNTKRNSYWRDMCDQQTHGPVFHDRQLKKVFSQTDWHEKSGNIRLAPYQSKAPNRALSSELPSSDTSSHEMSSRNSRTNDESSSVISSMPSAASTAPVLGACTSSAPTDNVYSRLGPTTNSNPSAPFAHKHSQGTVDSSPQVHSSMPHQEPHGRTEKDKELAAKYRLLQGSGWKKDWDGKWIRDEDAEFDSDEEPPDLP